MRVALDAVHLSLDGIPVVHGAALVAEPGEVVGLVGPNGSGKSTLLRAVYRALRPVAGLVTVGGDDVWRLGARAAAQRTAAVAQENQAEFDFSVRELVLMGRSPFKRFLETDGPRDEALVDEALGRVGAAELGHRVFATLSGGEKQRVLVARALVQQSRVLVLDEPTNHLDVGAQFELLELVRALGVTTLTALHDLGLAAAYCDRLYVLSGGRVVGHGAPLEVLTPDLVRTVFGVRAHVGRHPDTGRPSVHLSPLSGPEKERP